MSACRAWFLVVGLVACGSHPAPTETVCPDPAPTLTYDNFGRSFLTRYCTWCHDSSLSEANRHGAPLFHDFDTVLGVRQVAEHVDEQAGFGPAANNAFMPPDRCPSTIGGAVDADCAKPTAEERTNLALWLACGAP